MAKKQKQDKKKKKTDLSALRNSNRQEGKAEAKAPPKRAVDALPSLKEQRVKQIDAKGRPLQFRKEHFFGTRMTQDQVVISDNYFAVTNNFAKLDLFYDGNLFYDDITSVALRYSFTARKYLNTGKYKVPIDYQANIGLEKFMDSFPMSFFGRLYYEKYSFITIPEFGKGLQVADNKLYWFGGGFLKEFSNLLNWKFWGLTPLHRVRFELEIAQTLKTSTNYNTSRYNGVLKGNFLRFFMVTNITKRIYTGFFYSMFDLNGELHNFRISSRNYGMTMAYDF